jgi:hypothetical protein
MCGHYKVLNFDLVLVCAGHGFQKNAERRKAVVHVENMDPVMHSGEDSIKRLFSVL